jgi:hypothetical protein
MDTDQVRLGIQNPKLIARKLSQVYNQVRTSVDYNPNGISFIDQDWDNLIILDACRYDLFKEVNEIPGTLRKVESRGAATPEFLRGNFHGQDLSDMVYVTTNPMLYRYSDEIDVTFHDVINLWTGDTWNEEYQTVLPDVVTQEAIQAADRYPNKRLLVHYMQPHYPFIEANTSFDKGHIGADSPDELTTWMQILTGEVDIDRDELWKAYADNLRLALPHIEELIQNINGKTVVTSDHGNMFAERSKPIPIREWGHPPGIWTDELVKVPWLEVPNESDRREIVSESPNTESTPENDAEVQDRLESLGYV